MAARLLKIAGIVVFATAFFLPAVRGAETGTSGAGTGPLVGWKCALVTAAATAGVFHLVSAWQGKDFLGAVCLILSGWLNPLLFVYLILSIWARFLLLRRILAVLILVCLVATWIFLAKAPMFPLIGHYLWAAGALMMLAGEVLIRAPKGHLQPRQS